MGLNPFVTLKENIVRVGMCESTTDENSMIVHNSILFHEIMIDRSTKEVWPHLFALNKWNPQHIGSKIERISGISNKEGDTYLEYKMIDGQYITPVMVELAKVVDFKKIVFKVYPPDNKERYYFVDFSLYEESGRTRFVFSGYTVLLMSQEEFNKYPSSEQLHLSLVQMTQSLKAYVEDF